MSFGSPVGSPFNGPSAASTSAAAGLPFAGMPSELAERAEEVLADEPEHIVAEVPFSAAVFDREPFDGFSWAIVSASLAPSLW